MHFTFALLSLQKGLKMEFDFKILTFDNGLLPQSEGQKMTIGFDNLDFTVNQRSISLFEDLPK